MVPRETGEVHILSIQVQEIIRRFLIGSLIGAFIGALELWFYEFNLHHGLAAVLAGAVFGSSLGVFGPSMLNDTISSILLCSCAGGIAGAVWWITAQSTVSIYFSIGIGVFLGLLLLWGESSWKSTKKRSTRHST
jgi:hypothetical protein